jgi:hypothetical protein
LDFCNRFRLRYWHWLRLWGYHRSRRLRSRCWLRGRWLRYWGWFRLRLRNWSRSWLWRSHRNWNRNR